MGFSRKIERRAKKRQNGMLLVPVLNAPSKRMQVPIEYRDNLMKHYGLQASDLTGPDAFHIVFVIEGVVFGFLTKADNQIRVTLHVLELDDEVCIQLVGSEIYRFWQELPSALTFEELRNRYAELTGTVAMPMVDEPVN